MAEKPERRLISAPLPSSMDEYNLRETLEAAQEEAIKLIRERESIDYRIGKLQEDIVHLAALCRVEVEDPIRELGLTDAVRFTLAKEKGPMSVKDIVEVLRRAYTDISEYKNLPANVQTIIRRLVKAKEVSVYLTPPSEYAPVSGNVLSRIPTAEEYVWNGGLPPLPPLPGWMKKRMGRE